MGFILYGIGRLKRAVSGGFFPLQAGTFLPIFCIVRFSRHGDCLHARGRRNTGSANRREFAGIGRSAESLSPGSTWRQGIPRGRDGRLWRYTPRNDSFLQMRSRRSASRILCRSFVSPPENREFICGSNMIPAGRGAGKGKKSRYSGSFFILNATRHISRVLLKTAIFLDLPSPEGSSHLDGTRRAGGNGPLSVLLRIGFT